LAVLLLAGTAEVQMVAIEQLLLVAQQVLLLVEMQKM
jgi:hypothetical protein